MSTKTRRFATGYLQHRTGSEGPCHDPYGYEEFTVHRKNGDNATLHMGLMQWLQINGGEQKPFYDEEEKAAIEQFEKIVGISMKAFERAIHRLLPCCGNMWPQQIGGYPGEHFTICGNCGTHIDYFFDVSAVI